MERRTAIAMTSSAGLAVGLGAVGVGVGSTLGTSAAGAVVPKTDAAPKTDAVPKTAAAGSGVRADRIELGALARPASGVQALDGLPADVPVAPNARRMAARRGAARAMRFRATGLTPFSLVGLTWLAEHPSGGVRGARAAGGELTAAIRTADPAGRWSPWRALEVDDHGDGMPDARGGTGPLWVGAARSVEVLLAGSGSRRPDDVRLELIDPVARPTDRTAGAGRSKSGGGPEVLTRDDWGADERKMTWRPEYSDTIRAVCFHHTESGGNAYGRDEVPGILRSIYQFHAVSRKWGDIGYNALVDRFGRIWEGRAGGIDRPVIGAHAGGFNKDSGGISVIGSFITADVPERVRAATATWIGWKLGMYGGDPRGTTKLTGGPSTKYDHRVTLELPTVWPHRQTSDTDCPGAGGMRALPRIRHLAAQHT